ncbi:MAG: hypothetical protein JST13_05840, partial [Bacteroidetes bacterium]|nr:hypothetical protein [Bacteroidota bacterium]
MKRFLVWAGIFFLPFFSRAQDRFRFTPENPRPGDTVYFSYTPPAEWKNEIPHCVIRNVGNFLDNYSAWVLDFPGRVTEIEWSKIENEYKGQIITSPQTALLTFSFNYGHIQMESVGDRLVMKEGKTDWNDSAGFMIRMKGKDNQPVPLANFYAGRFIGSDDMFNPTNRLGMNNTALGINYLEQEIELYGASRNTMLAYYMMQKDIAKFRERSKELLEK